MAKTSAVWGIDIGQCALKALRCRAHEKDDKKIVVEAFDYIEYPKILSQPEANREELVREALEQFVSRNDVTGDQVAIAVPGQSGLARFIKLPPVEAKKIPDIVKYEARQQIPFALEDVVWDYQPLVGQQDEGYALETEVGLFAMKRDQVARHLKPLEDAGIEVDVIQLAPLAIYNFMSFDRLKVEGPYDPANQPPSTVIIALGTDTTDLVITNGYRVWQRSIPIGGNHFTKALTKELKLTFAKAEHLKRNAMKAENPKAVFQAMRPVFSDLVAEIQRSIGFFTSNNRNAKLGEMIALGNPMKLPGLQRFLSQNLDQEVKLGDQFNGLIGGSATAGPQFKENQLTFGVAYGLCVQALGESQINTNLLPEEIITTRLVRAKKPWVVAAVAVLLIGMTINYGRHYSVWTSANKEEPEMAQRLSAAASWVSEAQRYASEHANLVSQFDLITQTGENLQSNVDGRLLWLEVLKAIDSSLPRDERGLDERQETADDIAQREELHIERLECQKFPELGTWWAAVGQYYVSAKDGEKAPPTPVEGETPDGAVPPDSADPSAVPPTDPTAAPPADPSAVPPVDPYADPSMVATDPYADPSMMGMDPMAAAVPGGPSGEGYVIELWGHHFHNTLPGDTDGDRSNEGEQFIINTFFKNLETGTIQLPDGPDGALVDVKISDLGISHPVVVTKEAIITVQYWPEATEADASGGYPTRSMPPMEGMYSPGTAGDATEGEITKPLKLRKYNFVIHICWKPTPRGERQKEAQEGSAAEEVMPTAAMDDMSGEST
jgi:type IV pilus assembly protein PilM